MLKLTIAVLAVALAGSASAAGWRSLRVDGSSKESFDTSVAEFKEKLSPARYQVFLMALADVWERGTQNAEAQQSAYTDDDYLRELDGLAYEQVVKLTDPTGDTARLRLDRAIARVYGPPRPAGGSTNPNNGTYNSGAQRSYPAQDPAGNPNGWSWNSSR